MARMFMNGPCLCIGFYAESLARLNLLAATPDAPVEAQDAVLFEQRLLHAPIVNHNS
jgi:hypothetical protein